MDKYTNALYPDKINDLIDNEGKVKEGAAVVGKEELQNEYYNKEEVDELVQGGGAITNTVDFFQAVVGKKLNPTKFKTLLVNSGVDLSGKIGGGVNLFFGADYYNDSRTALGMTSNSDVDTLTFFICWREIHLTMPEELDSDSTLGDLLDAIADQVAANVGLTERDLADININCLANIAFLDTVTLVNLTDVAACFE